MAPNLIQAEFQEDQMIYREGDNVNFVYFLLEGEASFVLAKHNNIQYIKIEQGDCFGTVDLLPYEEKNGEVKNKSENYNDNEIKRQFSVKANKECQLLCLKLEDLAQIEMEYPQYYEEIFQNAFVRYK